MKTDAEQAPIPTHEVESRRLLSRREVGRILRRCPRTIHRLERCGIIKPVGPVIGCSKRYYDAADIAALITPTNSAQPAPLGISAPGGGAKAV